MIAIMTAASTRTLYAPNPPQFDEPWIKLVLGLAAVLLVAVFAAAS